MRGTAVKFNHNQQSRSQITPLRPVPRLRDCPIINIWLRGQIRNFEDNLSAKSIIIQFTSKPERGLFVLFSNMVGEKEKHDAKKHVDWLIFLNWNCDWTTAWQAVMSNWMNSRKAPWIKTGKSSALQTTLFENYLEKSGMLVSGLFFCSCSLPSFFLASILKVITTASNWFQTCQLL